jgi:hypothetical protein
LPDINEIAEVIKISKNFIGYKSKSRIIGECTLEFANPIPLSEEILLKCGFDYNYNESYLQYKHQKCPIYFTKHPRNKTLLCFIYNCTNGNTRFLHDFQNLYFALTGTELEINL